MKDYSIYTNEELVTMIWNGDKMPTVSFSRTSDRSPCMRQRCTGARWIITAPTILSRRA